MAVLALGLVGAGIGSAIGGTFLGMSAAGIGWTAGTILGNMLFTKGQRVEGPRLGDLSVQASTYGIMNPIIYGSMRVAGNVIFCTDKREVVSEQTEGGKGGPKVTTTTYSYNVDIAIALCQNEIAGIRKVWRNGELIYDASSGADVGTVLGSTLHAEGFTIYLGTESQLPDPTIEATVGAGLVPAYRGTAYVVFDHLDCPNGVIPQLTFEVVTVATGGAESSIYSTATANGSYTEYATIGEHISYQFWSHETVNSDVYAVGPNYSEKSSPILLDTGSVSEFAPVPCQGGPYAMKCGFPFAHYGELNIFVYDLSTGVRQTILTYNPGSSENSLRPYWAAYDSVTGKFCAISNSATDTRGIKITIMPDNVLTATLSSARVPMAFYDNVISCCGNHDGETWLQRYDGDTGALIDEVGAGELLEPTELLVHADANGTYVLDADVSGEATDRSIWKVTDDGWEVLCTDAHFENANANTRTFFANDEFAIVGPSTESGGTVQYTIIRYAALTPDTVPLADVIEDTCDRGGLDTSYVDTSGLTDQINGYALTQVASARSNLEPLLTAFSVDGVESDGLLKFRKRAIQSVVATVPFRELGSVESGSDPAEPAHLTRTQEAELPRSIAVSFIDMNSDYQPGTETARRQVTESDYDVATNLPIATYPDHMAQVAAIMLYDAWQGRNVRRIQLLRKYAYLDAGDNISVEYPEGTWTTKRINRITDTGLVLEMDVADSDVGIYDVEVPGVTPPKAQDGIAFAYPSKMVMLDMPILRDADNDAGFYAAVRSVVQGSWPGALIYKGNDSGGFNPLVQATTESVIGFTEDALDDWTGPDVVDEMSSVRVNVAHGELASSTRDAIINGTVNAMLIGSEVVQFHTATQDSAGTYTLTGFLRGRRGTEWAMTGHAVGERVVLLTTNMRRIELETAELDTSINYKAVTIGSRLDAAATVAHANTGIGLKPFSPVNLRMVEEDGQRRFTWDRRTRLSSNVLTNSFPLGEETESYDVELVDGDGDVVYEDTVTEPEAEVSPLIEAYTLEIPGTQLQDFGSEVVGVLDDYPASQYSGSIRTFDPATGLATAATFAGDAVPDLLVVGTDVYVTTRMPADLESFVHRYTAADIAADTGPTATYPGALAVAFAGLAYDGTYIWTAKGNDELLKLNATTLALVDTISLLGYGIKKIVHDSGYLYLAGGTGISKFNIGTEAVDLVIDDAGTELSSNMKIVGDLLFANGGVYDKATGARLYTVNADNQAQYGPGMAVTGGEVVYANAETAELVFLDETTGIETRRLSVPNLYAIAGSFGDDYLYVSRRVGNTDLETIGFALQEDLSGLTLRVYQNSSIVGRGYVAELAL